ncbi:hypothetical protein [Sorangium sp. So ce1024]|uniref:hypothetical protein n=1 Tax=unclassified Sorangium TaxID=2621164 RepID=UPI000A7D6427
MNSRTHELAKTDVPGGGEEEVPLPPNPGDPGPEQPEPPSPDPTEDPRIPPQGDFPRGV